MTLVPFGFKGGRMVTVAEVPRGAACGAVCPECSAPLIARRGEVREHHFAHATGTSCARGAETSLHYMAKQLLAEHRQLALPALVVAGHAESPDGEQISVSYEHRAAQTVTFDEVVLEAREGSVIPDARCTLNGHVCYVEFWVTHRVDAAKRERLRANGASCVEVRLKLGTDAGDVDSLRQVLSSSFADREWLWHRQIPEATEIARQRAVAEGARAASKRKADLEAAARDRASRNHPVRRVAARFRALPPAPSASPAERPATLNLRCDRCSHISDWVNDFADDYEPPCPKCGASIGRHGLLPFR